MFNAFIVVAILFFAGHGLQWLFNKTKIPDVLILIFIGYLLGPVFQVIHVDDFGKVGPFLTTLALVVILYEGGIRLRASELLSSSLPAAGLAVSSFILIFIFGMLCTLMFQPLSVAVLVGIGVGSTSAAVVIPLVRRLSISDRTKTMLSLEAAFADVIVIVFFLVAVEAIATGKFSAKDIIVGIGPNTLKVILVGMGAGLLWAFFERYFYFITNKPFAAEAFACLLFGLVELSHLNGPLAILAFGFTVANLDCLPNWTKSIFSHEPVNESEMKLLEEIVFLLKTYFFTYLGLMIQLFHWKVILVASLLAVLIFLTRYLIVLLLISRRKCSRIDAMIITAMGPRGLVCAVLASIPVQKGIVGGDWAQNVLVAIIPISIVLTSLLVVLSERSWFRLKMSGLFGQYKEDFGLPKAAGVAAEKVEVGESKSEEVEELREDTAEFDLGKEASFSSFTDLGLVRLDEDNERRNEPSIHLPSGIPDKDEE